MTDLSSKIEAATDAVFKAQGVLDKLNAEAANKGRIDALCAGNVVSFNYGRGDKRRVLSGVVVATGTDEKTSKKMIAAKVGVSLDIRIYKIRAEDVIFTTEE